MRQIVLDTETTGMPAEAGHRIIEIGAVEMINRRLTGNNYHKYINPEREVDEGAFKVHGLSNEFLSDKPVFTDLIEDFIKYIDGAELIIHNAPFDVGFLNHEFHLAGKKYKPLKHYCEVLDTLVMAKKKHPGQRNSLDALCKRYDVDNTDRVLHGALLDSKILAQVYLCMTGGQLNMFAADQSQAQESKEGEGAIGSAVAVARSKKIPVIQATIEEMSAHDEFILMLKSKSEAVVWR